LEEASEKNNLSRLDERQFHPRWRTPCRWSPPFAHFAPEAEIRFAIEESFPAHSHKVQSALTKMKSCEIPDYNRAVKASWAVMVQAAALGFVWVLDRVLFLQAQRLELSSILTFSRVGLLSLLVLTFTAATYWTCQFYLQRLNAKTREAEQMGRLHLATAEALATAIDAKDQTTHCHVRRVQTYAIGLGKLFGLSRDEISALEAGALLHDVGKLAVPDHILNKPGSLTPAEFEKMKAHTVVGSEILSRVEFPYPVLPIVRHHHEQWDGQGYPDGLRGEQIPITARIMAAVDCFDTAREDRPFRPRLTREEAIQMLNSGSGTYFDPRVVRVFVEHLPQFEAEISALGLNDQFSVNALSGRLDNSVIFQNKSSAAYDQIRNAHREVYALYEIARTFGSSLEVENTICNLIEKVSQIVPFDTCAVFLYDETKGYARVTHVRGKNTAALHNKCVTLGEGVTGFTLANRRAVNRLSPSLDFRDIELTDGAYRAMASLPLSKDDLLLGALSVYSTELKDYSDDHLRLLESVTRLASDALANALQHARAESNALTDALTGLPNARCLHVRFEQEAARSRRTGRPFQVVMLDLDEFKTVNDTFGHKIGDKMLREVAAIVHAQLREYDFLARYAGDEFVALVQDLSPAQIEELCERIETAVSSFSLHVRGDLRTRVGISVGAAVYGTDGENLDQLLMSADQAMYRAKSAHKLSGPLPAVTDIIRPDAPSEIAEEVRGESLTSTSIN